MSGDRLTENTRFNASAYLRGPSGQNRPKRLHSDAKSPPATICANSFASHEIPPGGWPGAISVHPAVFRPMASHSDQAGACGRRRAVERHRERLHFSELGTYRLSARASQSKSVVSCGIHGGNVNAMIEGRRVVSEGGVLQQRQRQVGKAHKSTGGAEQREIGRIGRARMEHAATA